MGAGQCRLRRQNQSIERWTVYRFAEPEHAERFRKAFHGEPFDPKHRGKGTNWMKWRRPA